ncbi:CLUMA_CG011863, isoform A [Clunio marinus]|uniref:CLUMA_CG011863, isoform A n=1 Tax=Clunio marinus TaxID=568069 RepID=A0A1J1IE72_9DIPT|nr:CLUMA_CG011863, isoform A [Clunio marinus]
MEVKNEVLSNGHLYKLNFLEMFLKVFVVFQNLQKKTESLKRCFITFTTAYRTTARLYSSVGTKSSRKLIKKNSSKTPFARLLISSPVRATYVTKYGLEDTLIVPQLPQTYAK